MEDQVIVHGVLQPKNRVLTHPDFYTDVPMLILRINKEYLPKLLDFYANNDVRDLEVTIREWPKETTERAKKYFFALRDRVCEAQGDTSKDNKDHIYRSCICDLDLIGEDGIIKNSIKELSQYELWMATEHMYDYCIEAEVDLSDIARDFREFQTKFKKEIKNA